MASGIYQIYNLENGHRYVGSAVNLPKRKTQHFNSLARGIHENRYLQNAFNLYGRDKFVFLILLFCEQFELLRYEQYFLDTIHPEYNICKLAGSSLGIKMSDEFREKCRLAHFGKKLPQETIEKLRQAHIGQKRSLEARERMSIWQKGKKKSPELIEKMRLAKTGTRHSTETKAKMSVASLGKKKSPEHARKIKLGQIGKFVSDEIRLKQRLSHLGKSPTEETRKKLAEKTMAYWNRKKAADQANYWSEVT